MQLIKDYQQMAEFVKIYFDSHDPLATQLSSRFSFRRRFDHCLRCSIWARRIALSENADVETVVISALFHDIGKSVEKELAQNHGEVGAQICDDYLKSISYDNDRRNIIVRIVRNHSNHTLGSSASLETKVVSDADLLDETGAIMVLWDAMASAGESTPSYEKAYEHIKSGYIQLKDGLPHRPLHTNTARQILSGRLLFVDTFLKNLEYELGRSETL
jgi:putative nucleotidyltransferase with HDIG domain